MSRNIYGVYKPRDCSCKSNGDGSKVTDPNCPLHIRIDGITEHLREEWEVSSRWDEREKRFGDAIEYLLDIIRDREADRRVPTRLHERVKIDADERERFARAVLSVCDWGRKYNVWITVDDAVTIVSNALIAWQAVNVHEAVRDQQLARYGVEQYVRTL